MAGQRSNRKQVAKHGNWETVSYVQCLNCQTALSLIWRGKKTSQWWNSIKISFAENSLNLSLSSKTGYCSASLKQKSNPLQQHLCGENKTTTTLSVKRFLYSKKLVCSFGETVKSMINFIVALEKWTIPPHLPSERWSLELHLRAMRPLQVFHLHVLLFL